MARGRKKTNRSPRKKFTGVNVLNLAEAYVLTNIWTEVAFKTNPIEFITGFTGRSDGSMTFRPGTDGAATITLPELLGAGPGGIGGNYGSYADGFMEAVTKNIGGIEGLFWAGLKSAGVGVGFTVAKKMTRKVRSTFKHGQGVIDVNSKCPGICQNLNRRSSPSNHSHGWV